MMMPNMGGPKKRKRRLLGTVAQSLMLYSVPAWANAMQVAKYRAALARVQRKGAIRACCAYSTISLDAVQVIAGTVPIELLARERLELYEGSRGEETRKAARLRTMLRWQE
ncbi:PREDICTED: uncharacterized protein LOC108569979 [Nicrophorus vespilloides]|uniref:Uncharacterized protein LOC108569979 n=1 Tax=Nicrophorus vespilloides TaxID=110193 RepID=A0ABM1NKB6_NICVS|nr:PREDICTED: uncharacterized protein LOC108569979 [Nicrophorus vespilloides]